ncbi:hypothetical protein [Cellulomonas composti]|uniref:Uncharacterized protein n=1 Tax=Cellulomonas composti TaxID=266130 RepID=A0A511J671_9CELL|nr:hypothetical protein [Cellulomonas composti]GEL93495.1 hypothetical protein CCO02nite_01530 [Cellulomonas composti]
MARTSWWVVGGLTVTGVLIVGMVGVASGCIPTASACAPPGVGVRLADDPHADEPQFDDPPDLAPGAPISVVGYGFGFCDDTGSEFCSQQGRVTGDRDVVVYWRQSGTDQELGESRLVDGGLFQLTSQVPADATQGTATLVVVREGGEAATGEVRVVPVDED